MISVIVVIDSVSGKVAGGPEIHARGFAEDVDVARRPSHVDHDQSIRGHGCEGDLALRAEGGQGHRGAAVPAAARGAGKQHVTQEHMKLSVLGVGHAVDAAYEDAASRHLKSNELREHDE